MSWKPERRWGGGVRKKISMELVELRRDEVERGHEFSLGRPNLKETFHSLSGPQSF